MIDSNFYQKSNSFKLYELAQNLKCEYLGDKNYKIEGIETLENANEKELSFLSNKKYVHLLNDSKAGVFIIEEKYAKDKNRNYLISDDPYFTMANAANLLYPDSEYPDYFFSKDDHNNHLSSSIKLSRGSLIHATANLGENCTIGLNSVVGPGVRLGKNCIVGDNVSIYFSIISDNVKIYQGVRLGGEGFGFAINNNNVFKKIPQLGRVIIEDNVEIGCNTTVDRGSIGDTIIKKNTMIDNIVHIAHNVTIGKNCIIAAMTGISGSVNIGNNVMIGGQVGISGHLTIGNNVKIAAKSGVMQDIKDNNAVGGYPANNILDWHRSTILMRKRLKK